MDQLQTQRLVENDFFLVDLAKTFYVLKFQNYRNFVVMGHGADSREEQTAAAGPITALKNRVCVFP